MNSRKGKILLLLLFLLILGAGAFFLWRCLRRDDPEKQVRRRWKELFLLLEKPKQEGLIVSLEKAKKSSKFCMDPLKVFLPGFRVAVMNRQDAVQTVLTMRKLCDHLALRPFDMTLAFNPEKNQCIASFGVSFDASGPGGKFREVREFDVEMILMDGKWYISRIGFQEIIRR